MNISYTRVGDYLLPNLKLKEGKQYNIGKYGLLKLRYLKEYNRGLYTELLMKEQLNTYLYELENLVKEKVNELIISLVGKIPKPFKKIIFIKLNCRHLLSFHKML